MPNTGCKVAKELVERAPRGGSEKGGREDAEKAKADAAKGNPRKVKAAYDRFIAAPGQIPEEWKGVEVIVPHGWVITRARIKSYNPATRETVIDATPRPSPDDPASGRNSVRTVSDPTGRKGIMLATLDDLRATERWLEWCQEVEAALPWKMQIFLRLRREYRHRRGPHHRLHDQQRDRGTAGPGPRRGGTPPTGDARRPPGGHRRHRSGDPRGPRRPPGSGRSAAHLFTACLLYTSDAADDLPCVDLGGRRIHKKKKHNYTQ